MLESVASMRNDVLLSTLVVVLSYWGDVAVVRSCIPFSVNDVHSEICPPLSMPLLEAGANRESNL